MSCAGGKFSSRSLPVKSLSGSASTKATLRASLKLSVVAISTNIREGLSARAQMTPESAETSPDYRPCVIRGWSLARLINGRAMPPIVVSAVAAALVAMNRRRVADDPIRIAIEASPYQLSAKLGRGR